MGAVPPRRRGRQIVVAPLPHEPADYFTVMVIRSLITGG